MKRLRVRKLVRACTPVGDAEHVVQFLFNTSNSILSQLRGNKDAYVTAYLNYCLISAYWDTRNFLCL